MLVVCDPASRFGHSPRFYSLADGLQFRLNPMLGIFLRENREENLRELSELYRLEIVLIDDPRMHREDYEIYSLDGKRDLKAEFV